MMTLIFMIIVSSTLCCFMNHPLTLGMVLLAQTLMVALLSGMMALNFWLSYIVFLIMIGGMLILFIYMTSVASNEKFKFSMKMFMFMSLSLVILIFINFMDKYFITHKLSMIETFSMQENANPQLFINKFINFPHNMIYLMMTVYLLITLIAIVKISSKTKGMLRKNF